MYIVEVEFDNLHVKAFIIEQHKLARNLEIWNSNESNSLPCRGFNNRCIKRRLIADDVNMRAFLNHELIFVLERVTPCPMSQLEDNNARTGRLHKVSGAVGAPHLHLNRLSIISIRSSPSTYL